MVILEILRKQLNVGLPDFEDIYSVISQQYFLNEEREKAEKLRDEINKNFRGDEQNLYHAMIKTIW